MKNLGKNRNYRPPILHKDWSVGDEKLFYRWKTEWCCLLFLSFIQCGQTYYFFNGIFNYHIFSSLLCV